MRGSWNDFKNDPFVYVDRIKLTFKGYDFNIFHDDAAMRRVAFGFAAVALAGWILMGFDSTPVQLIMMLYHGVPGLLSGQLSWGDLPGIYFSNYGKDLHWSALAIYVFLYWGLSKNWARVGVTKTKNVLYSFSSMFLAIGVFEWFWMLGFSTFQNQPWVLTWVWPQMRILMQNLGFTLAGGLTAFYIWVDSFKMENHLIVGRLWYFPWRSWKLWLLVGLSVATALLWIYYPWYVEQISVTLKDGQVWHSSRLFPQTLYTINLDPGGAVNAGEWNYVENNWIHGINTLVKFLWALTIYYSFKVRKGNM